MSASTNPLTKVPELRNGDHLDRDEFERRYNAMPHLKKAELIDGVVYMPSPVRFEEHGEQHANLMTWLGLYRYQTPGVRAGDNSTVRLNLGSAPQPDAVLLIDPKHGGQVRFTDGYITDGPELAAEVAASSVSYDAKSSCDPTSSTASVNTCSGASKIGPSTGSCCAAGNTFRCRPVLTASSAVRSLLACGSILAR